VNVPTVSVRNREGFYTAEALRDGMKDQYAVLRSYGKVVVELYHDGTEAYDWHVVLIITSEKASESTDLSFNSLDEARREFRRRVRNHP